MDSVFQNLNRFDIRYSHAHCLDARIALGTRLSFIATQPASRPVRPKIEMRNGMVDHRETVTISVAVSERSERIVIVGS